MIRRAAPAFFLLSVIHAANSADDAKPKPPTMPDVLAASKPSDWRPLDPENTLYLELTNGRVVIELVPAFAPQHVANVKALAREHYFDGLAILRCQDNYVTQWGDPEADKRTLPAGAGPEPEGKRRIKHAKATLPPEFDRHIDPKIPFTR